jgi:hypothetical protein
MLGYSGHSYVAIDTLIHANFNVTSYCDLKKKKSIHFV